MAASSGARPERIPVSEYKARLRQRYGAGRFRIRRDGRIDALCGCWIVFGRIGDPATIATLFGRGNPRKAVEPLSPEWYRSMADLEEAKAARLTAEGQSDRAAVARHRASLWRAES